MALPVNSNFSILPFYSDVRYQNHRKKWINTHPFPLISGLKKLPPFQVYREHPEIAAPITLFQVVEVDIQANGKTRILGTTDVLTEINAAGLEIREFASSGYDLIVYSGTALATQIDNPGLYYAILSDAVDGEGNTWYSEIFTVRRDVTDLLKLSFWHDVGLAVPGHHISYATPFQNFVYLDASVNKPEYSNRPDVNDVDGIPFNLYQTSIKTFRFNVLLPEFLHDILRLVPHHYHVLIESDGLTYEVLWINTIQGEWISNGHLCPLEVQFLTDTIVSTTGKLKPEAEGFAYDQTAYQEGFS